MTNKYHKRRFKRLDSRRSGYGLCIGLGDRLINSIDKSNGKYWRSSGPKGIRSDNIHYDKFLKQRLTITKSIDSAYDAG